MSDTSSTPAPEDPRVHAEAPAEGDVPDAVAEELDEREHSSESAEGSTTDAG